MAQQRRWLTAVIEHSAKPVLPMPWTRGAHRARMIAARKKPPVRLKHLRA